MRRFDILLLKGENDLKNRGCYFVSNKQRIKKKRHFFAGVGAVLLVLMMLKWLPISADWELTFILFGLGILFYLKRMLWKEEKDHKS